MRLFICIAAINGALAVLFGAFAAHGLAGRIAPQALQTFTTAGHYHLVHALAMGLAALTAKDAARTLAARAALAFLLGILLFSGSLYLLALTSWRVLGFITPLGGIAFIAGWALLALAALKLEKPA